MIDNPSTGTIFVVAFLGALLAILVSLAVVYTYVTLRLIPKIKGSFRSLVAEIGPRAVFEQANLDPAETMRQFGVTPAEAAEALAKQRRDDNAVRVIFTCEDHGRCMGCPKVLAQFEAIIKHQGEETFDEVEQKCYTQLRTQLEDDALRDGEAETDRQKRLATRVIEALVREGCTPSIAQSVVWSRGKKDRETFAAWLSAARSSREKLVVQDEEDAA